VKIMKAMSCMSFLTIIVLNVAKILNGRRVYEIAFASAEEDDDVVNG